MFGVYLYCDLLKEAKYFCPFLIYCHIKKILLKALKMFVSACLNLVVYNRYMCLVVQLLNEKVEELTFPWRENQFSWNSCLKK